MNDNLAEVAIVIIGLVVLSSIGLIIYFHEREMSNYVHHTNSYAPIGDYSVEIGKSSDSILNNCGANKNNRCCYNATSLLDAINFVQINKGRKFSYQETSKNTCIIDPTNTNYRDNPQSSIYTLTRFNINQDSNGATRKEQEGTFDTSLSTNTVGIRPVQPRSFNYTPTV